MTSLDDAMRQVTGVNVVNENAYQTRYQSRGFTMDNLQKDGISSSFQNSIAGMGLPKPPPNRRIWPFTIIWKSCAARRV
jgi:outer membrane receptor for ferric coprogen and ferric-rhodotorulic acid